MSVHDDLATLLHYGYIAAGVVVRRRNEVKDAHDRVEAEIARLEQQLRECGDSFAEVERVASRCVAAEAEAARLRDGLRDAESVIRTFHEACWDHDGDLPDEIEAAAGEALAFLGDSFCLSEGAA